MPSARRGVRVRIGKPPLLDHLAAPHRFAGRARAAARRAVGPSLPGAGPDQHPGTRGGRLADRADGAARKYRDAGLPPFCDERVGGVVDLAGDH